MLGEYSYVPAVSVKEFVFIPCLTNQELKCSVLIFLLTNQSIVGVREWMVSARGVDA